MEKKLILVKHFCAYILMFCIVFCLTLSILFFAFKVSAPTAMNTKYLVVLDAGHGGQDGGAVSPSGVKESDINLEICKLLQKKFCENGINVLMTRETKDSLGDGSNFKKEDMRKRKQIIETSGANIVISVHLNKFGMSSRRGAQVFVSNTEKSKLLGKFLQDSFNTDINKIYNGRAFSSLVGDYFILKCSNIPSIIAECGFLSNSEDEKLLQTAQYQNEIAKSLYTGAIKYLFSI